MKFWQWRKGMELICECCTAKGRKKKSVERRSKGRAVVHWKNWPWLFTAHMLDLTSRLFNLINLIFRFIILQCNFPKINYTLIILFREQCCIDFLWFWRTQKIAVSLSETALMFNKPVFFFHIRANGTVTAFLLASWTIKVSRLRTFIYTSWKMVHLTDLTWSIIITTNTVTKPI